MKIKKLIFLLLLISPLVGIAQGEIFEIVEEMPKYPGGNDSLFSFISKNLSYPAIAKEKGKKGKVYIKFIVEPDKSISHLRVLKTFDESCSKAAMKVIKLTSGNWIPGTQRDKKVRVAIIIPVEFGLPILPIPEIVDEIEIEDDFEELIMPEPAPQPQHKKEVFEMVESMPKYLGGYDSLKVFINNNLRYPNTAKKAKKEGNVYLKFVVEPDGRVSKVRVLKSFDADCSDEAVRLIKLTSGKWQPGEQRGKKVRVNVVQPIVFKLD